MTHTESSKRELMVAYARRFGCTTFIETGTYKGDTVKAMLQSNIFKEIHTIDIYEDRARRAMQRYAVHPNVHCWCGDSAESLPEMLCDVTGPTLFWLDAHHSGKQIARSKGLIETPILKELDVILAHRCAPNSVILIDDSRYFKDFPPRYPNYPTTETVLNTIRERFPDWVLEDRDDIIRCHRDAVA